MRRWLKYNGTDSSKGESRKETSGMSVYGPIVEHKGGMDPLDSWDGDRLALLWLEVFCGNALGAFLLANIIGQEKGRFQA
jgi:hypothetical protein